MCFNTNYYIKCIENSLFKERVIEPSQLCSVGWEDPTEQQEKARVR